MSNAVEMVGVAAYIVPTRSLHAMALDLDIRLMLVTESRTYAYNLLASYLAIQHIAEEGLGCRRYGNGRPSAGRRICILCSTASAY